MPHESPQIAEGEKKSRESVPPQEASKLIDAMCAFCETVLGADPLVAHTCKCMECGDPVREWKLREDSPPLCDPCMLGIGTLDDEDDLDILDDYEHAVRG